MPGRPREQADATALPSAKKTRHEARKGAITRIKLHNFMTYTDAEIIPGPRLNLVLGPNGTGKSSLVNAICLGLAGSPSLLGRADNVRDFVRRGQPEGFIQIWLCTGEPNCSVCIKRSLKSKENSSEWKINGKQVQLREVKQVVKDMHVQLENLCQFLAQDKVVEFAKLKPRQLLEETQKAVGDSSLYDLHQELITERNELKAIEAAAQASKQELEVLERMNEGLTRDVKRVKQRAELEQQVTELQDKLAWIRYRDLKEKHDENLGEYQLNLDRLNGMRKREEESAQPKRQKEQRREAAAKSARETVARLKKLEEDINRVKEALDGQIEALEEKQTRLDSLDAEHEAWQAEIGKLEAGVQRTREELEDVPQTQATQQSQADQSSRVKRLDVERREALATVKGLQHQADERREELERVNQEIVAYHEQMRRLSNIKVQRLRMLESGYRGITELAQWLDKPEARAMFKGRVYGPLLCEVTVDGPQHAAWLEQHCPRDLWARFVTEYQEDQDRLAQEAFRRFRWKPIVTNFSGNANEVIAHRHGESSRFSSWGVVSTLDEGFQAPQTVKLAMCSEANLNETYCANRTMNAARFLEENPDIVRLLTPESVYVVRKSRYNPGARSMNVSAVRPATLLAQGGASNVEEQKQALQRRMEEANARLKQAQDGLRSLETDIREEDARANALGAESAELQSEINKVRNRRAKLAAQLRTQTKQLDKARAKPDPRAKLPALEAAVQGICARQCEQIARLSEYEKRMLRSSMELIAFECGSRELAAQARGMQAEASARLRQLQELQQLMEQMERGIAGERQQLQQRKKEAVERTGRMSPEIKARFAALPGDARGVEDLIAQKTAEADAIQLGNPRALDEYNQRRQDIERLAAATQAQQDEAEARRAGVAAKKDAWLPQLRRVVAEVDRNFRRSFERIGCAGEVRLHEAADPATGWEEFAEFAIHIRVRFRAEEEMLLLTAHRQSGGERSVSTILYLIAIQNVTACPFRVVDEINQGMDPVNERKVFTQLVEAACQPATPQCFLLTPKLLPGLPFSEHVTLLEIFNGPLIEGPIPDFGPAVLGGRTLISAAAG